MTVRLPSKSLVTPEAGAKRTTPVLSAARISMADGPVSFPTKLAVAPAAGEMDTVPVLPSPPKDTSFSKRAVLPAATLMPMPRTVSFPPVIVALASTDTFWHVSPPDGTTYVAVSMTRSWAMVTVPLPAKHDRRLAAGADEDDEPYVPSGRSVPAIRRPVTVMSSFTVRSCVPSAFWNASLPVQRAPDANTTFAVLESASVPVVSLNPLSVTV